MGYGKVMVKEAFHRVGTQRSLGETHAVCACVLTQSFRSRGLGEPVAIYQELHRGVGEPVAIHREYKESSQWDFSAAVPVRVGPGLPCNSGLDS